MKPAPHPSLFDTPSAFKRSGTSEHAAAHAAHKAKIGDLHRKIWDYLRNTEAKIGTGLTADEVAEGLGILLNTSRARISELRKQGWVEPTKERRPTAAGRPAEVYRAIQKEDLKP